jgi:hypothetical protein
MNRKLYLFSLKTVLLAFIFASAVKVEAAPYVEPNELFVKLPKGMNPFSADSLYQKDGTFVKVRGDMLSRLENRQSASVQRSAGERFLNKLEKKWTDLWCDMHEAIEEIEIQAFDEEQRLITGEKLGSFLEDIESQIPQVLGSTDAEFAVPVAEEVMEVLFVLFLPVGLRRDLGSYRRLEEGVKCKSGAWKFKQCHWLRGCLIITKNFKCPPEPGLGPCNSNQDCYDNFYCPDSKLRKVCTRKRLNGSRCTSDEQCNSGVCERNRPSLRRYCR